MSAAPFDPAEFERAQVAELDAVQVLLAAEARAWARQLEHVHALTVRADSSPNGADRRFLVLELAGSWRISQLTAARWVEDAGRFSTTLPRALAMLRAGTLFKHQALTLLHRTRNCTAEVAQAVEAELLPAAAELCPSDLGKQADRIVLRLESEQTSAQTAEQRHAAAAAERRTFTRAEPDGMALAGAVLTAEQQVAWSAGLDALERRERAADRAAGSDRTAEQRRADLFAALPAMVLAGTAQDAASDAAGQPRRPWTLGPEQLAAQVVLNVHVPVATVLDLSREPGTLDRYGPISAEHVRLLRPASVRRVMLDGRTGRPIAVDDRPTLAEQDPEAARQQVLDMLRPAVVTDADEPQHDPSARLARLVDLRDVHCCGPGCSSSRTDRDHLDPWPAGPTNAANLGRLSRRCHAAKHHGWQLRRHPDGSTTWLSPLHRSYTRPSPHPTPPRADLYTDPPPLRQRPRPSPPAWASPDEDKPRGTCAEKSDAGRTASSAGSPASRPYEDDDPPPF